MVRYADKFLVLWIVVLAGCDTPSSEGSTTTSGDSDTDSEVGMCGQQTISVIESLGQSLPGFAETPAQLRQRVEGEWSGSLAWDPADGLVSTPFSATVTTFVLSMTVGEGRFTELELDGQLPNTGDPGGYPCANTIEFDVAFTLTTGDNSLAFEQVGVVTFSAHNGVFDDLYHPLVWQENMGSLTPAMIEVESGMLQATYLTGEFSQQGFSGSLLVEVASGVAVIAGGIAELSATKP